MSQRFSVQEEKPVLLVSNVWINKVESRDHMGGGGALTDALYTKTWSFQNKATTPECSEVMFSSRVETRPTGQTWNSKSSRTKTLIWFNVQIKKSKFPHRSAMNQDPPTQNNEVQADMESPQPQQLTGQTPAVNHNFRLKDRFSPWQNHNHVGAFNVKHLYRKLCEVVKSGFNAGFGTGFRTVFTTFLVNI